MEVGSTLAVEAIVVVVMTVVVSVVVAVVVGVVLPHRLGVLPPHTPCVLNAPQASVTKFLQGPAVPGLQSSHGGNALQSRYPVEHVCVATLAYGRQMPG